MLSRPAGFAVLVALGCAAPPQDPAPLTTTGLHITRSERETSGRLEQDGVAVAFQTSEGDDGVISVSVELNGVMLTAIVSEDRAELDGVNMSDGLPASLTGADRAAIAQLVKALEDELYPSIEGVTTKEEYRALRHATPAEERLFNAVEGIWAQWPDTMSLSHVVEGEATRSWTSRRRWSATTVSVTACHDCSSCSWSGDCCDSGYKVGEWFNDPNYG